MAATKNNGIRLDACQRMKSANGFFDGKFYIGWNLSSVGEKDVRCPRQNDVFLRDLVRTQRFILIRSRPRAAEIQM
jgi:hypothetical protein